MKQEKLLIRVLFPQKQAKVDRFKGFGRHIGLTRQDNLCPTVCETDSYFNRKCNVVKMIENAAKYILICRSVIEDLCRIKTRCMWSLNYLIHSLDLQNRSYSMIFVSVRRLPGCVGLSRQICRAVKSISDLEQPVYYPIGNLCLGEMFFMYELNVLQSVYSYNLAHFDEQRLYEKNIFLVYRFTPTNSKNIR